MNYIELLNLAPPDLKNNFRKYENLCQKKIKNHWSLVFNDVCLSEKLMPIYTKYICSKKSRIYLDFIFFMIYLAYIRKG